MLITWDGAQGAHPKSQEMDWADQEQGPALS